MIKAQAEKNFLKEKNNNKLRNKVSNILFIFILLVMTGLVSLFLPVFNISKITVEGNERFENTDIIELSGLEMDNNIFKAKTKIAKERIEEAPYIKAAQISRILPSEINILIEERIPVGFIEFMGTYILIDREGFVLEVITQLKDKDLLLIEGLNFNQFSIGDKIQVDDEQKLKVVEACLNDVINTDLLGDINKIDIRITDNIKVEVDNRIIGIIGKSENLNYKLSFLKEILKQLNEGQVGSIDLSVKNPTFREIR